MKVSRSIMARAHCEDRRERFVHQKRPGIGEVVVHSHSATTLELKDGLESTKLSKGMDVSRIQYIP